MSRPHGIVGQIDFRSKRLARMCGLQCANALFSENVDGAIPQRDTLWHYNCPSCCAALSCRTSQDSVAGSQRVLRDIPPLSHQTGLPYQDQRKTCRWLPLPNGFLLSRTTFPPALSHWNRCHRWDAITIIARVVGKSPYFHR